MSNSFVTLWTIAHQVPLSTGFSCQENWSGLPCLPPGDLPNPGGEPTSPTSPALAGAFFPTSATREAPEVARLSNTCDVARLRAMERTVRNTAGECQSQDQVECKSANAWSLILMLPWQGKRNMFIGQMLQEETESNKEE